jgi:hypothetical protein
VNEPAPFAAETNSPRYRVTFAPLAAVVVIVVCAPLEVEIAVKEPALPVAESSNWRIAGWANGVLT